MKTTSASSALLLPVLCALCLGAASPGAFAQPSAAGKKPAANPGILARPFKADDKGAGRLLAIPAPDKGRGNIVTYSSFDRPGRSSQEVMGRGSMKFQDAPLDAVLKIYQELSGRTVIYPASLPSVKITFENATPFTRIEALQALDTVLAANNIAMVLMGTRFVKAVPSAQANTEPGPVIELPPDQLPDSGSYMIYFVRLKDRSPSEVLPMLQPFAKLPNSLIAIRDGDGGLLILRDYSANIRRMLTVLAELDKTSNKDK